MSTEPSNNSPAQEPKELKESTNEGNIYYVPRKDYQPSEEVRNRGFHNGILRVDPDTYVTFLTESEKKNRLARYVRFLQEEISRKQAEVISVRGQKDQYERDQIEGEARLAANAETERVVKEESAELSTQKKAYLEKREAIRPLYGWLATALYLVAGFVFMATDFSITKSIAWNTLDMADEPVGKWLPLGEATIFALGLAFLAFVFKPAVDRIFEQPYFQEKQKKRMFYFLSVIAILAVANLAIMGSYRKTAWRANNLKDELNLERTDLLERNLTDRNEANQIRIGEINQEIEILEDQIDSWQVRGIFMLSSILFAIAGAICFSISLPLAREHTARVRYWYWVGRMERKLRGKRVALQQLLAEKTALLSAKSLAELRLPELRVVTELEKELSEIRALEQDVVKAIYDHHTNAQTAWYLDNYQRGNQYYPADNDHTLQIEIKNGPDTVHKWNLLRDPDKTGEKGRSQYLYQQIRDYINEESTKDNVQASQNGVH